MDLRDDDLFSVAGSLAELLGAPVTIEDENSTVLAYSGGEQAVDEARIGTILGPTVQNQITALWDGRRILAVPKHHPRPLAFSCVSV